MNGLIPGKPRLSIDQFPRSFFCRIEMSFDDFGHEMAPQARIFTEISTFLTKKPEILGISEYSEPAPDTPQKSWFICKKPKMQGPVPPLIVHFDFE